MKIKLSFVALLLSFSTLNLDAQELTKLWTGLRIQQPESEMPHGNAPFQKPLRIDKRNLPLRLQEEDANTWLVLDSWEMTDNKTAMESMSEMFSSSYKTDERWYNAVVPGTILTTLVHNGVYPDPYYGLNNMSIPESLCRTEWWYRTPLVIPSEAKGKELHLIFEGINYKAEVFLNGKIVGDMKGAFCRGDFDITSYVKESGNILAVHVYPPANPGIPHEQSMIAGQGLNGGMLSEDGPTFISTIGWDWVPGIRDRNSGIWQDVKLEAYDGIKISDVLIKTDLPIPDTSYADLTVSVDLKNVSSTSKNGKLKLEFDDVALEADYSVQANSSTTLVLTSDEYKALHVEKPRLWWPNGYGNPNLYVMKLSAGNSDTKEIQFGIREMSYELMLSDNNKNKRFLYTPNSNSSGKPLFDYVGRVEYKYPISIPVLRSGADKKSLEEISLEDPMGPYLVLRVNGKRIFCRGGNWGMDDAMKNVTIEHLEPYFALHKDAHFNIIRNWTGESTEESFYSLCDKYGMLVWNDFWITTDDTVEPNDVELFISNARETVKRFRNHPCIAVWCPRNEGYAPDDMAEQLQSMMAVEDPTRHYHGQSRLLNMDSSGPWGFFKDPSVYYTTNAKGFLTEIGTYAVPTATTLRKFIAEEDLWPINDVWAYHDLHHTTQNFPDFMEAVASYGKPSEVDDFAKKAQFVCYDSWRSIMEAWGSKMWNNTSGQILWMSHPAWPSMIWQTYSYDYETPGSFFGVKKACEPIHIQANLPDHKVVCINSTLNNVSSVTAEVHYYDLAGKKLYSKSKTLSIMANSLTEVFTPEESNLPEIYLMRTLLKDSKGKSLSINDYWCVKDNASHEKLNSVPASKVSVKIQGNNIEFYNSSSSIAIAVKPIAVDSNGKQILPALFSDGYFNLLPKEKRVISLNLLNYKGDYTIQVDGYNL